MGFLCIFSNDIFAMKRKREEEEKRLEAVEERPEVNEGKGSEVKRPLEKKCLFG